MRYIMRRLTFIVIAVVLSLVACSTTPTAPAPVRIAMVSQPITVALWSSAADTYADEQTEETSTLYTASAAGTIRDVQITTGATAFPVGDDDGWGWGGINQTDGDGMSIITYPTDACGVGSIAANTTLSMATLDPGCTGLGVDDGMGGVTWPRVGNGSAFTAYMQKGGGPFNTTGIALPAFDVSIVLGP